MNQIKKKFLLRDLICSLPHSTQSAYIYICEAANTGNKIVKKKNDEEEEEEVIMTMISNCV